MSAQEMLALETDKASAQQKATPHLLPCRVNYNGSVEAVQSFWDPRKNADGDASTAYFRGRKLHGKTVKLPEGYRGVIAAKTEKQPSPENHSDVIDLEREDEPGKLQVQAEFDDMVIWGHEATADVSSDPYVRGMEEWLALSEQIHSYDAPTQK